MASLNTNPGLHHAQSIQSFQTTTSASSESAAANAPKKLMMSVEEFAKQQPGENVNHRIIVGAGPRGAAQVAEDLLFMLEHAEDFDKLAAKGAKYEIATTLIDRKSPEYVARGNGWGPDQGVGTVNTTPEAAQDHKARLKQLYLSKREELSQKYAEKNPIAYSTLKSAFDQPEGTQTDPTVGRAAITRADQGAEELEHFKALCSLAHDRFPFLKVSILTEASVDSIDVTDAANPKVLVKPNANRSSSIELSARGIVLNTGTTVKNPISDPEVRKHTFAEPMNQERLGEFLKGKNLLDDKGELKEGAKLLVGGTGLSLYDQLIALHGSMNLMEVDESSPFGYKITDAAKEKYKDALTVVSFTPGKWISPRHSNSAQWTQKEAPLASPEELHAALLHEDGREVYKAYTDLVIASVANTLGITPEAVHQKGLSTEELLTAQGESTQAHLSKLMEASSLTGEAREKAMKEATWTLEGARREGYLSTILGMGMAEDPAQAVAHMESLAPLTFKGRSGYMIERAQPAGVTAPDVAAVRSNRDEMGVLTTLTNDVTASPFRVHYFAVMLHEAGIMKYQPGSYNDFKATPGEDQLSFKGKQMDAAGKYDAFVVSPTFDRKAEPVLQSLTGKVKPVHPEVPDLPALSGNRLMRKAQVEEGESGLLPIQDFGYNGAGAALANRNKVGLVSYDVNNRDSAYDVSPGMTLRRMAQEHLYAAKLSGVAFQEIEDLYAKHAAVTPQAFADEVRQFAGAFESMQHKAAFVRAAETSVQGNPELLRKGDTFAVLMELFARSKLGVDAAAVVAKQIDANPAAFGAEGDARMKSFTDAMKEYGERKDALPAFNPTNKEEYFSRFIDYPMDVHKAVYQEAMQLAENRLAEPKIRRRPNFGQ